MAAGGSDTYNNLFTDLSPIIALFGEQVTKQFLAQSTTFGECVLFALAPLGILTGVVSAIRVGGYPWLKAIVGRAAESKAAAGLELTSATSSSICELWDGRSVVRVHGSPKILTVVYLERSQAAESVTSAANESEGLLENYVAIKTPDLALADVQTAFSLGWLHSGMRSTYTSRRSTKVRQTDRSHAVEWEQDEETLPHEQASPRPRKPIPPIPPNIALNASRHSSVALRNLCIAGVLLIQVAVLIFGGLLNYRHLVPSKRAKPFAYPLMAIGTILISLGMTTCAAIVVLDSQQERWRPTLMRDRHLRVMWLQRKQTVNDELFLPYAISPLEPELVLSYTDGESNLSGRIPALLGTVFTLVGFIIQFIGLRDLHWAVSVAQLLAMFLATALRIIIRTSFSPSIRCTKLNDNFELEWFTFQIDDSSSLISGNCISIDGPELDPNSGISKAVNTRMQLGAISEKCGWQSSFTEEAQRLHETIDEFMNLLWVGDVAVLSQPDRSSVRFCFGIDLCKEWNCTTGGFSIAMKRARLPGLFTSWTSDPKQLEAYLALWIYELQNRNHETNSDDQEPFNTPQRCIWKACSISALSAMDFDWWVRRGYTYYKTPRSSSRSPVSWMENHPTAESPFCRPDSVAKSSYLLTVATNCSISCLCARYLFAVFLQKALQIITSLNGITSIRPSNGDSVRELIRFQNTAVDKMCAVMASKGLISLQDSYTLLIPALRYSGLLPDPLQVQVIKNPSDNEDWDSKESQISAHCYLRTLRALRYQGLWGKVGSLLQSLSIDHIQHMQEFIRIAEEEQHSFATSGEQTGHHEATRDHFFAFVSTEASAQDVIDKCKNSHCWLDRVLQYGYFDSKHQDGLRSVLKHLIMKDDYSSVMLILLSLMDEPTTRSLRNELVDLSQYAVQQPSTITLSALMFYALKPFGMQRGCGTATVIAAQVNNTAALKLLIKAGLNPDARDNEGKTPLITAAAAGNIEAVKCLLEFNPKLDAVPSTNGMTALATAIYHGHEHLAIQLIEVGCDPNPPSRHYGTPLQMAAARGFVAVIKLLCQRGADVNYPAPMHGRTSLQAAVEGAYGECIEYLLQCGAELDAPGSPDGYTALQIACLNGHLPLVQLLLSHGATVNTSASVSGGHTALQAASLGAHSAIVELLLESGAFINARASHYGLTAIQAASTGGNLAIFNRLHQAGASIATPMGHAGTSALQAAAKMGHTSIVSRLLTMPGIEMDEKPALHGGFTALQAACIGSHQSIVEQLLKAGANVNSDPADHHGRTALQAASETGSLSLVNLLIQANADVNAAPAEDHGVTALQAACQKGHLEIARKLYQHSADIEAPPCIIGGRTALQAASEAGHREIVVFLLEHGAFAHELPACKGGSTALQAAKAGDFQDIIALLMEAGAHESFFGILSNEGSFLDDWSLQYRPEWTVAPSDPNSSDIGSVISAGSNNEQKGSDSVVLWSPLAIAASKGDELTVSDFLVDPNVNPVNAPPAFLQGRTALQAAAENGHDAVVAQLLSVGAEPNFPAAEIQGFTALEVAAKNGHLAVVRRLLTAGADVDVVTCTSEAEERPTAVQLAARNGHLAVVKELVGKGADIHIAKRGIGGLTALEGAQKEGWDDVSDYLKGLGARN